MDIDEYRQLTQPGIILDLATRKALKRYRIHRAVARFCIVITLCTFWVFTVQAIRYFLNG